MNSHLPLGQNLTILVCSCDSYQDLWIPFFTLLKKYWDPKDIQILLNTESYDFPFDGLDITVVHSPCEKNYGQRMLNALSCVNTKYVLPLLDDFFLRSPVDENRIREIIRWMDEDSNIAYFNCDSTEVYADWEINRYPGFRRIPPGNRYIFNMQAAIWRTNILKKCWLPNVSPWEWEMLSNARSVRWPKLKFYCTISSAYSFINYGYNSSGMGVFRGKWVINDVAPLFEKENILMDFSLRGEYIPSEKKTLISTSGWGTYEHIEKCLGSYEVPRYYLFYKCCQVLTKMKKTVNWDYFTFLQHRAQKKFLKKHPQ